MDDLAIAASLSAIVVTIPFYTLAISCYHYAVDGNPFVDKRWKIIDSNDVSSDDF